MIEEIVTLIIKELGPAGLLICGLYFLLGKHLQKMCGHIETINHELGEIKSLMVKIYEKGRQK